MFEARIEDLERNIALFPSKREIDDGVFWDEDLLKRSLEEAELEPPLWEDPERARLFHTGTNPTMTVDNAFEKLDLLQEDWANGRLDGIQRAKSVAMDYKVKMRHAEMGYVDRLGGSPETWKASAERLVGFEKNLQIDILSFV